MLYYVRGSEVITLKTVKFYYNKRAISNFI